VSDEKDPFHSGGVDGAIELALNCFRAEREEFTTRKLESVGADAKAVLAEIEKTADALIKGAGELASLKSIPMAREMLSKLLKRDRAQADYNLFELLNEGTGLSIGWEASGMVSIALERFWPLLGLTQEINPTGRTTEFLKRVSRCCMFGFDAECVILCRSVLDSAFDGEISVDDCVGKLGPRKPPYFPLADRIAVAQRVGRISADVADAAREIKRFGDAAVHRTPAQNVNVIDIVARTIRVLAELYREND
jgi:hypothetical protein